MANTAQNSHRKPSTKWIMEKASPHCYRFTAVRYGGKEGKGKQTVLSGRVSRPVGGEDKHWRLYCEQIGVSGQLVCDGFRKGNGITPFLIEAVTKAMKQRRNELVTLLSGMGVNSERSVEWPTSTLFSNPQVPGE